ncbi:MAG: hypothetical protein NC483_03025 [Ruminococcus sp.]|nr:hypothetical protein [Ruminococcus sp.]
MLKNLEILNGDMPLKFNSLNTIYTINLYTDDDILKFNYEIDSNDKISVAGNNLTDDINEVVLTVYNDLESESYYLYVYKNEDTLISKDSSSLTSLEIASKEEVSTYAAPTIGAICFLIILLTFTLLFKKKKKCRF